VKLAIDPTNVPANFIVCVGFNPAATKGVFVHYDAKGAANSLTGLPGAKSRAFPRGDWMIRIEVDQPKDADALSAMPIRH
jgi:RNA polymerase sigma-70 factor (ECF subfamily)